jgi:hypothetical protein
VFLRRVAIVGISADTWLSEESVHDRGDAGEGRPDLNGDRRLSMSEKASLVLEIVAAYVRVRRSLRNRNVREAVISLRDDVLLPRSVDDPTSSRKLELRLARAVVRTLSFLPLDSRCLWRALVLTHLLSRRGRKTVVVIGVRNNPTFGAHAWVESEGIPLLPGADAGFERLVEL